MSLKEASDALSQHDISDSLTDLHTQNACLKLLVDLESVAEGAYYTPLKDLTDRRLVRLSAQIMSCEAQHWTVVSGLRNPPPGWIDQSFMARRHRDVSVRKTP